MRYAKLAIGEGAPWEDKCSFVLVFQSDFDLIITKEVIHKQEDFTTGTIVDNMVDKGSMIIIFWTRFVQILIIDTYTDSTLFFGNRHNV